MPAGATARQVAGGGGVGGGPGEVGRTPEWGPLESPVVGKDQAEPAFSLNQEGRAPAFPETLPEWCPRW